MVVAAVFCWRNFNRLFLSNLVCSRSFCLSLSFELRPPKSTRLRVDGSPLKNMFLLQIHPQFDASRSVSWSACCATVRFYLWWILISFCEKIKGRNYLGEKKGIWKKEIKRIESNGVSFGGLQKGRAFSFSSRFFPSASRVRLEEVWIK